MELIRKIMLVGAFSKNKNIYTYTSSFERVLQGLGYIVEKFNYRKIYSPFLKLTPSINEKITNYEFKKLALKFKPDLILIIKGETISPKTLIKIKNSTNSLIVNFYPDNPFVFWNGNSNKNVILSFPYYDSMMTWSKILEPSLISAGAKKTYYFPFCYDDNLFKNDESQNYNYLYDAIFVGTWDIERQEWLEKLISKTNNLKLAIFGNEWRKHITNSPLIKFFKGEAVYERNMFKAFKESKIVLNFIRKQNYESHNMRTMEALASKSLLLTERTIEQSQILFKENEHLICFSNIEELISQINFYLDKDHERNKIATAGFNAVKQYSLQNRIPDLIANLEKERTINEYNKRQSK